MGIAREGEEFVCPTGTLSGRMIRNIENQLTDDDFCAPDARFSADGCERVVPVRENHRWRVHLRHGWVR